MGYVVHLDEREVKGGIAFSSFNRLVCRYLLSTTL
jgi:hypothetical protein